MSVPRKTTAGEEARHLQGSAGPQPHHADRDILQSGIRKDDTAVNVVNGNPAGSPTPEVLVTDEDGPDSITTHPSVNTQLQEKDIPLKSILSSPKSSQKPTHERHHPASPVPRPLPGSQTVRRGSLTLVLPPKPFLARRGSTPYNFRHQGDGHKHIPDNSNFLNVAHRDADHSNSTCSSVHEGVDYILSEQEEEDDEADEDDPLVSSYGSSFGLPETDFHRRLRSIRRRQSTSRFSESSECASYVSMTSFPRKNSRAFTVINYGDVPQVDNAALRRQSMLSGIGLPVDFGEDLGVIYSSLTSLQSNATELSQILPAITVPRKPYQTVDDDDDEDDDLAASSYIHSRPRLAATRSSILTQTTVSLPDVARRGYLFSQRKKNRLVNKDGGFNVTYSKIDKKGKRFLADSFTTMLDMRWRYTLLLVVICFLLSWVLFALFWWLISIGHKDHIHKDDPAWVPCVVDVYDFPTALLFSIETQHTIGYGSRSTTPQCLSAIFLMMTQSIFGMVIQCVTAGVFLAKLARPKSRGQTIMFSKTAVICQEDGEYVLAFRVGDMRTSQIVSANLHATLVRKRITQEGEEIPFHQCRFDVKTESEDYDQFIFLSWPIRVVHKINENSPLWGMSLDRLLVEEFEILVVLEGVVEATGMTTQVRTSYLPAEILWGYRLAPLLTFQKDNGRYNIDYTRFHETCPVDMPETSAKKYHAIMRRRSTAKFSAGDDNNNTT